MTLRIYEYKNCDTCRKALKFLNAHGVAYTRVPIREQPPTKVELERMLTFYAGDIRKLFNTSGGDYQAMKLKDRLPTLTADAAIELLARHGNLVKRPFVLGGRSGAVGFDEARWRELFVAGPAV